MPIDQIQKICPCGCATVLITAVRPAHISEAAFLRAWKNDATNGGGHHCTCNTCGCEHKTIDDGVAVGSGGNIAFQDESKPRIDSLGATASGSIVGGTTVRVNGHSFNTATPTVKFGGVAGTGLVVIDDDTLDIVTPAGTIELVLADGPFAKIVHGTVSGGPFQVDETLTGGTSGETCVVKEIRSGFVLAGAVSGGFTASETLTGSVSTATADYTSLESLPFQVAETITGATSGETATVASLTPFKISSLSGAFTAGEEVTGGTSLARAELHATSPMNGDVDVTVENVNGARPSQGRLASGFSYT